MEEICDKCSSKVDSKWVHYIQDNTFSHYCEEACPAYIFCNNCWELITDGKNLKIEQETFEGVSNWCLTEEYKNSLYPYGKQEILTQEKPVLKRVACFKCKLPTSYISNSDKLYFCQNCEMVFQGIVNNHGNNGDE